MQLEKLDLLEKRLGRFIERYAQLKDENERLSNHLKSQAERIKELEADVVGQRGKREKASEVIGRMTGVLEKLEKLQDSDMGAQ